MGQWRKNIFSDVGILFGIAKNHQYMPSTDRIAYVILFSSSKILICISHPIFLQSNKINLNVKLPSTTFGKYLFWSSIFRESGLQIEKEH